MYSLEVSVDELRALVAAWRLPVSPETLRGYASVLRKHRVEDVREALAQLISEAQWKPRRAVPHVGIIVDRVRLAYRKRLAMTLDGPAIGSVQGRGNGAPGVGQILGATGR